MLDVRLVNPGYNLCPAEKCADCPLDQYGMTCTSHRVAYWEKRRSEKNERLIVFDITEVDGKYDITTKDSRALGYGCRGLSSTEVLGTMQEMSKWLHAWLGFEVVFAFEGEK